MTILLTIIILFLAFLLFVLANIGTIALFDEGKGGCMGIGFMMFGLIVLLIFFLLLLKL